MTSVARTSDVLASIRTALHADAQAAAGNSTLSKEEQAGLAPGVLQDAAAQLRTASAPGARVTVDAVVDKAVQDIERLFAAVNQPDGAGAATVSKAEVLAVARQNPDAGQRLAKAYELLTGRPLVLDGVAPTPAPTPAPGVTLGDLNLLHPKAFAFVQSYLSERAGGNDVFNAQERAALPHDFIRDAAYDTPPPRSVYNITSYLFGQLLDPMLGDCGVDIVRLGGPEQVPFTDAQLARLVAVHPDAAGLFADAIAATTGRRPDLPGLPPARFAAAPPPPPRALDMLNVGLEAPDTSPYKITATLPDAHTIEIKGPSVQGGRLSIALPDRVIDVPLGPDPCPKFMLVDLLRRAVPDLDVRVVANANAKMRLELWPAGTAPKGLPSTLSGSYVSPNPDRPGSMDFKRSGETGLNSWNVDTIPGERIEIEVERKLYAVTADASTPKVVDLFRALAAKVRADGWKVDVIDYHPNIYCAFKFVMP